MLLSYASWMLWAILASVIVSAPSGKKTLKELDLVHHESTLWELKQEWITNKGCRWTTYYMHVSQHSLILATREYEVRQHSILNGPRLEDCCHELEAATCLENVTSAPFSVSSRLHEIYWISFDISSQRALALRSLMPDVISNVWLNVTCISWVSICECWMTSTNMKEGQ